MLLFLSAIAIAGTAPTRPSTTCANLPTPPKIAAVANDNRSRAGTMRDGALSVRLVALRAAWRPDGPVACALGINAFAEEGKAASVPGPLIRVNAGTEVRVTVRNALPTALWVRGLQDRAVGRTMDSTEVLPGARWPLDRDTKDSSLRSE